MYRIKIANGYFAGYYEALALIVFDEYPGAMNQARNFNDKKQAEAIAKHTGGILEEVS